MKVHQLPISILQQEKGVEFWKMGFIKEQTFFDEAYPRRFKNGVGFLAESLNLRSCGPRAQIESKGKHKRDHAEQGGGLTWIALRIEILDVYKAS
jgi:hypothetical protein